MIRLSERDNGKEILEQAMSDFNFSQCGEYDYCGPMAERVRDHLKSKGINSEIHSTYGKGGEEDFGGHVYNVVGDWVIDPYDKILGNKSVRDVIFPLTEALTDKDYKQ